MDIGIGHGYGAGMDMAAISWMMNRWLVVIVVKGLFARVAKSIAR